MYRLQPSDFSTWFCALQGSEPFPWQKRLFHEWLCPKEPSRARWPAFVNLPTGCGKTTLIDLAILALACGSPCARRRIAFVVDRRLIVDEAAERAERVAQLLRGALEDPQSPLHAVARALLDVGGDAGEPLLVAKLRGGMDLDDSWARNPAQPVVILSTVDQFGSRLLFRAYGATGRRSWPIPAGLLGVDTLVVVDEAHCSRPFCETLSAIEQRWQKEAECPIGPGLILVQMSATLPEDRKSCLEEFGLEQEDFSCERLAKRLRTPKPVTLRKVIPPGRGTKSKDGRTPRQLLEDSIVEEANTWLARAATGVLAIVVNRVASARNIFERLALSRERKLLLTGRVRPWERDRLLESWLPRIRAGREGNDPDGPLAVVATQCIEVGADFDFDHMITEAASLDALRQRFGRVDRLGRLAERMPMHAPNSSVGVVVAHDAQLERDANDNFSNPDPIYGAALPATWEFLTSCARQEVLDFSSTALAQRMQGGTSLTDLVQSQPAAYPLLPAYLDLLAHTSPPPEPDVEIAAFLHGATRTAAEVTVVWRAGLEGQAPSSWAELVALQPPAPGEGCPVPIWEVRAWLEDRTGDEELSHDLEGVPMPNGGLEAGRGLPRPALAWRGPEDSIVRQPEEIRPGDLLIVPCEYGGCTEFGWDPRSTARVRDIGDLVATELRRRPVLRLAALDGLEAPPSLPEDEAPHSGIEAIRAQFLARASEWEENPDQQSADIETFLGQVEIWARERNLQWLQSLAARLRSDPRRELVVDSEGRPIALVGSKSRGEDAQTGSDVSSFRSGRRVLLSDHQKGVAAVVAEFAQKLGLPDVLRDALIEAALSHDLGKHDPRFQAWLAGQPFAMVEQLDQPLAKSPFISPRHWSAIRRARTLARYPEGNRHEALSVAILRAAGDLLPEHVDRDLVLHLVGSHHGHSRPWFPVVEDPNAPWVEIELKGRKLRTSAAHEMHHPDGGSAERFWRLLRRYGWWGLAYLEAILRLADHRRSLEEESHAVNG